MSGNTENKKPRGFEGAKNKAKEFIDDKKKTRELIKEALEKASKNKDALQKIWGELQTLIRLIKAWLSGKYKTPWKTILFSLAAIIYFVNPLDFIPDLIPFFGFLDDASIIAFVIKSIRSDIKNFLIWEKMESNIQDVEIINGELPEKSNNK